MERDLCILSLPRLLNSCRIICRVWTDVYANWTFCSVPTLHAYSDIHNETDSLIATCDFQINQWKFTPFSRWWFTQLSLSMSLLILYVDVKIEFQVNSMGCRLSQNYVHVDAYNRHWCLAKESMFSASIDV